MQTKDCVAHGEDLLKQLSSGLKSRVMVVCPQLCLHCLYLQPRTVWKYKLIIAEISSCTCKNLCLRFPCCVCFFLFSLSFVVLCIRLVPTGSQFSLWSYLSSHACHKASVILLPRLITQHNISHCYKKKTRWFCTVIV